MKKYMPAIICLLISVLLVFSLAACQETTVDPVETPSSSTVPTEPTQPAVPPYMPANAAELWGNVEAAMDSLESMEITGTTNVVYYYMGYEFKLESSNYTVCTLEEYYGESVSKVTCEEASIEQNITTKNAYYDGKMYLAHDNGVYDQKLCSVATKEQFRDTLTDSLTDINITECTGGKFTKDGKAGWTLEFSGYTKKTISKVLDMLEISNDMLGADIEDMKITVNADAYFYIKSLTLAFVFVEEEGNSVPEFSMNCTYSKYYTATFDPEVLKAEEYVEVADLFVLDQIMDGLTQRQNATSGNFVLDLKNTTRYYGQSSTSKETDVVTYGKKNNAYYYSISAEVSGSKMALIYQNGMQTITADGETYSNPSSDAEAKALVDGLIDSAMFDTLDVTNIEKEGEGVYMLTCENLNLSKYSARVTEGITLEYGEQAIKVTFRDGELVKIESLVCLEGKYNYNDIEMDLKTVVDFEKEADYPTI